MLQTRSYTSLHYEHDSNSCHQPSPPPINTSPSGITEERKTTMEEKKSLNNNGGRRRRRRLLLFPLPFQGHLNPMLQLASILYTQNFSITIIHTLFNAPNPSNYPHFTFKSIDDGSSVYAEKQNAGTVGSRLHFLNESCVKPLSDCLAALLEEEEEPIACLIADTNWYFTQAVADRFKLPRIVLRTSSLSSFLIYTAATLLFEKANSGRQASNWEARVPEFPEIKLKDIPKISSDPVAFCSYISSIISETKKASAIIWNTFRELEEPAFAAICKEFPVPNFTIGPFHKYFPASSSSLLEQDRSFMSWLDLQAPNSVIYISFGSVAHLKKDEFKEMARGLANSKQPFLWVVRPGSVNGSEWLEFLPNGFLEEVSGRGYIIKWAPQQEVLAHPAIGCFWTHNGWNSTLESICEGVPMICSPCFIDQPINSRYVHDVWRVGVYLENGFESGEIEIVIKRVMVDEEGKEIRERINLLKKQANLCLEQGGSSYQSLERLTGYILSL